MTTSVAPARRGAQAGRTATLLSTASDEAATSLLPVPPARTRTPPKLRVRAVYEGRLGRLMTGITLFELADFAAVLLILRATKLLDQHDVPFGAAAMAVLLYLPWRLAAAGASVGCGRLVVRHGAVRVMAGGVSALLVSYAGFAFVDGTVPELVVCFLLTGAAGGAIEAAEHVGVAQVAPAELRWSAFGSLTAVRSFGRMTATVGATVVWTVLVAEWGLLLATPLMVAAVIVMARGVLPAGDVVDPAPDPGGGAGRRPGPDTGGHGAARLPLPPHLKGPLMTVDDRLRELGIELPTPYPPAGLYVAAVRADDLVFLSGAGPVRPDGSLVTGKVGRDVDLDAAREAARLTGLQLLAALSAELGGLDRVTRVVKVFGMVNCAPGFSHTPQVIDGCSQLLVDVLGDAGRGARSAVGMAELPFDIAVEIEAVVEVADGTGRNR